MIGLLSKIFAILPSEDAKAETFLKESRDEPVFKLVQEVKDMKPLKLQCDMQVFFRDPYPAFT